MIKQMVFSFTILSFVNFNLWGQKISKEAVLQDLHFLRSSLEEAHYDLYSFTSKSNFEVNFKEVRNSIQKDSLSLKEATGLFQKVISRANTGHAEIDFPALSYISYAKGGGTVFPLELAFEDGKARIRKNFSGKTTFPPGVELLSINGKPIEEILERIYPHISAEREYFKNAKVELWSFPRLYWQVFGEQKKFDVKIKANNINAAYQLESIEALEDYEYKRKDVFDFAPELEFFGSTAYIYPGAFSSQHRDGENIFKSFIDSAFTEISSRDVQNLIVDLRYNSGGHDEFSNYLIAYFANKSFRWNSEFKIKVSGLLKEQTRKYNDTSDVYFKAILSHKEGEVYTYDTGSYEAVSPEKRYRGQVYVLINRQTYSMAAVAAALIQDYGFATIVGEETGEFPTLHASQFSYMLPNTGVMVKAPKGYIVRPDGSRKQQGVIPDITIKDHLLDEEDEILDTLLKELDTRNCRK